MENKQINRRTSLAKKYRQALSGDSGEAVLKDLMHKCHFVETTFSSNENELAFKEGQRSVLIYLLRMSDKKFDVIQKLMEDNDNERVQHFRELYGSR